MKRLFFLALTISLLSLSFPSNALALRLGVAAFDKTRSNPDPKTPDITGQEFLAGTM